jgi:hypothetical protein
MTQKIKMFGSQDTCVEYYKIFLIEYCQEYGTYNDFCPRARGKIRKFMTWRVADWVDWHWMQWGVNHSTRPPTRSYISWFTQGEGVKGHSHTVHCHTIWIEHKCHRMTALTMHASSSSVILNTLQCIFSDLKHMAMHLCTLMHDLHSIVLYEMLWDVDIIIPGHISFIFVYYLLNCD